jgi:hypothetical protein
MIDPPPPPHTHTHTFTHTRAHTPPRMNSHRQPHTHTHTHTHTHSHSHSTRYTTTNMTVGIPRDIALAAAHVFLVVDYAQALGDINHSNNVARLTTTPIDIASIVQRTLVSASIDTASDWNSSAGPYVAPASGRKQSCGCELCPMLHRVRLWSTFYSSCARLRHCL